MILSSSSHTQDHLTAFSFLVFLVLGLGTASTLSAQGSGAEIRGRILRGAAHGGVQTEDPFPAAHLELLPVLTDYEEALRLLRGERLPPPVDVARSGPQGSYVLRAPSPGLWHIRVSAPGFLAMERLLPVPADRDVEAVSLRPAIALPLKVLGKPGRKGSEDREGSIAAWAIARAVEASGRGSAESPGSPDNWHPVRDRAWTKAEGGVVRIPRAPDEELEVRVVAPGYESRSVRIPPGGQDVPVRLNPEPLRLLRLNVLDPFATGERDGAGSTRGVPVEDALLLLGAAVPGATGLRNQPFPLARTDPEGGAEILVPREGSTLLTLLAPDGRQSIRPFNQIENVTEGPRPQAAEEVVRWTLPPPVSIVGRALDQATGDPVPGAVVWFQSVPGSWVRTDAQGFYHLPAPPKVRLVLRAEASGYRGVEMPGQLEGDPLRADVGETVEEVHEGPLLPLTPVVTLRGSVVDEGGEAVPGAEIRARVSGPTPGRRPFPVEPVESGPDGRFRFSDLTPGVPHRLTVRAEGFAPTEVKVPPIEHRAGSRDDPSGRLVVEIVLAPGRVITGTVVDEEDQPVTGARVALLWRADTEVRKRFLAGRRLPESVQVFEARTGERGSFRVVDLPAGRFELVIQAEGFAPYEVPGVELPPESTSRELGRLVLVRGLALEGEVTGRRGQPVMGAEVFGLVRLRQGRTKFPIERTRTDEDGRFRLDHLTEDLVFDLHVRHSDYSTRVVPNIAVADRELLRIELERPAVLTGRVMNRAREPVAGAWVGAKPEDAVDSWVLYIDRRGVDPTTHTDAEGRFSLPDVGTGLVRLSVKATGFQPYTRSGLEILPGTETEVEVLLETGVTLSGLVQGADGRPLPGVSVQGAGLNDRTDPAGRFRLVGISPGNHQLVAWDDHHGRLRRTVEVPPEGTEVELVFPAGYPVSGQVVAADDEAVPRALVSLEPATERTRAESSRRSGLTDSGGEFDFQHVPPGTYQLLVQREGLTMGATAPLVEVASAPVRNLRISLRPAGVVVGQVLGLKPGEAANLVVEARGPDSVRRGAVSSQASYRIEGLSPGEWVVTAEVRGSGRRAQGRVRLRAGEPEAHIDLELGEGLTLAGQVRENGSPLADAEVLVFDSGGNRVATVRTDRFGSFLIAGLEPGAHDLELVSVGRQLQYAETFSLERDRRVTLDLKTGSLGGRVIDAEGTAISGASVLLEPLGSSARTSALRWLITEADGHFTAARLLAGPYRLTVRAPGAPTSEQAHLTTEITIPPGSRLEDWTLELVEDH